MNKYKDVVGNDSTNLYHDEFLLWIDLNKKGKFVAGKCASKSLKKQKRYLSLASDCSPCKDLISFWINEYKQERIKWNTIMCFISGAADELQYSFK